MTTKTPSTDVATTETPSTDVVTTDDALGGEVVPTSGGQSASERVRQGASGDLAIWTTITGDDFDARLALHAAITDPVPLSDNLNKRINVSNWVCQAVEIADDKTGVITDAVRVVLIDADGTAYSGTSEGLFKSVQNLIGILGHPSTWPAPVPLKVVEKRSRAGFKFFTLVPA